MDAVSTTNLESIARRLTVIASLNANKHLAFKVVVFSDTVIVYNVDGGNNKQDASYLIMFLCEFVKDLIHRLTGKGIFFRAVITYGDFTHYELNGMPCFFGNALVDAYNSEKELKAIGLFIHKSISQYCDIFPLLEFNENYNFVFVTQSLEEIEVFGSDRFPIPSCLIEDTDSQWQIFPELDYISNIYSGIVNQTYPESVQAKYKATWEMYCKHYPSITKHLVESNQVITSISPQVKWNEVIERFPEDFHYAVKTRIEF